MMTDRNLRARLQSCIHKGRVLACLGLLVCLPLGAQDQGAKASLPKNYGKIPLHFEPNVGQSDPHAKFISRGSGYAFFLTPSEAVLVLRQNGAAQRHPAPGKGTNHDGTELGAEELWKDPTVEEDTVPQAVLRTRLLGANPDPMISASEELPGKANYFIGNDPKRWRTNIPSYGKVKYDGVYPGVDLVYYGNQAQLEYDFVLAPGASPKRIRLGISGNEISSRAGARRSTPIALRLDTNGDLVVNSATREVRYQKPVAYQTAGDGHKQLVAARFVLKSKHEVGFAVPSYDRTRALVIDPTMIYSTYIAGATPGPYNYGYFGDEAAGIAVDSSGSAYITGATESADFPITEGAYQTSCRPPADNDIGCSNSGGTGETAVFVSKLSPDGSSLVYSTYIGGSYNDNGTAIAVDSSGNAYIAGQTLSPDFPVTANAYQTICGPRLDPVNGYYCEGWQIISTCGSVGYSDGFVTKLNPTGSGLVYSTFLGGSGDDYLTGIAVDSAGEAYVSGVTLSGYSYQGPGACGCPGGGYSCSPNYILSALYGYPITPGGYYPGALPAPPAGQPWPFGKPNAFTGPSAYINYGFPFSDNHTPVFSKLSADGSTMLYSTYIGGGLGPVIDGGGTWMGTLAQNATGIAIDSSGDAYLTGYSNASDLCCTQYGGYQYTGFPTTPGVVQPHNATYCANSQGYCGYNAFVSKFDPTQSGASSLVYSTNLGSTGDAYANAIAVDSSGDAYVVGTANPYVPYANATFPTTQGTVAPNCPSSCTSTSGWVAKLNPTATNLDYSTYLPGSIPAVGNSPSTSAQAITLDSAGNAYVAGQTTAADFPQQNALQGYPGGALSSGFVSVLNPTASTFLFSTFLGGNNQNAYANNDPVGIALDSSDNMYVTGSTTSSLFPTTTGAFQTTCSKCASGSWGVFVTAISSAVQAPTITSTNSATFTVGVAGSFTVTTTGTPTPSLSESGALPSGVTFVDNGNGTGTLGGTPAAGTGGTYTLSLTASNGVSPNATQTFTLTVNPAAGLAPTTTAVSTMPSSSVAGQAYTVSVTVASQSSGTPTGTVSVIDSAGDNCQITLSGGAGNCPLTSTLAGSLTIMATYSGDTNFAGSSGMTTQTVLPGVVAKLLLNPLNATITAGQSQTYSAQGFDAWNNSDGDVTTSTTFLIAPNGSCTGSTCTATAADANGSVHTVTGTYTNGANGSASLTVNTGSFTQLQLLVPGEAVAPGTASGFTGTPNTEYVNGPFNVTVNAVDPYWNVINTVTDTVAITSSDPLAALPANAALVAGTGAFSVTLQTVSYNPATTTLTATDATNSLMTASTSPAIPVIVVYTASISPADAATGQATTYTLTVSNAAAPNSNNLGSLTVAIPASGGTPTNISITATQPSGSTATWGYDTTASTPTMMNFRRCTATGSLPFDNGCTSDATNALQPGGTIVIQFTATSSASVSGAAVPEVWTTTAYSDASYTTALPLAGTEPTVSIGVAPTITSANSAAFTYNSAGGFTVAATGVPTPTLTETGSLPGGVTFTDNGNGTATLAGTPSAAGTFPLTLTAHNGYGSDATQSFTLTVNPAAATVTLSNLTQTYTGSPLSPTATTIPSGLKIVWTGAPQTNAGTYSVTATVNTPNYQGSASGTFTITPAQPTVSFTGAPASAAYQSTFGVTATTNAGTTATITASGACSISGTTVTMTSGTGTCSLTANWAATNNYQAASATQSTIATKATPTVTFTGAPATAVYGSTFTITSTTNASTKPTYTGTSGICSVSETTVTMKGGTGTCTLTASWASDSNYVAATATQTTTAVKANSTATISANTPNPSVVGQAIAVRVSVAPVAPTTTSPTGNVSVSDGVGDTCKATLSSGSGSCNISVSAAGTQTLTATYNGDTNFNTSASAGVSQTVNMASTTTTITPSPTTSVTGQPVTVKFKVAPVSPGKGTPTGTVAVTDGAGDACSATVATGNCVITITTAGTKTLTGTYSGDSNFAASTSAGVTQTVNQAKTKTTITAYSPNPSVAGQAVTFTFTVVPVSPGSGTPTGTVTVSDAAGDTCTATVATGSCAITYASSGNKSMTASYAGDANFASSKSAAVTQAVTDFSISAPATKTVKAGSQATITITVAPKNSFVGTVALSCSAPTGVTCSLSPASVTPSGSTSATSTATVGSSTKGTYTLTFTGVYGSGVPASGGLTHSTTPATTLTVD